VAILPTERDSLDAVFQHPQAITPRTRILSVMGIFQHLGLASCPSKRTRSSTRRPRMPSAEEISWGALYFAGDLSPASSRAVWIAFQTFASGRLASRSTILALGK
jgi:hypothetical protein